jgi:hypothetical protein
MARRASLPGASELFRPTSTRLPEPPAAPKPEPEIPTEPEPEPTAPAKATATGRVKHDHKITVYFSEQELLALEDANLELRRQHSIRVDRGRLVRTAVALALRDLADGGDASALVRELREE